MIQILGIALAVSLVANAAAGWALKGAWEDNAALNVTMEANTATFEKALNEQQRTIETLQDQRAKDQTMMLVLGEQNNEVRKQLDEQTNRLNAWRGRLATRALAKPAVAERAARIGTRRWMCNIWEASGGDRDACPRTSVPSSAARARQSRADGNPGADARGDQGAERANSGG